jgi:signal transduction histidine kinase
MEWFTRVLDWRQPAVIVPVARFGVVIIGLLALVFADDRPSNASIVALAAVAILASVPVKSAAGRWIQVTLEAGVASAIIAAGAPHTNAFLPYLVVPSFAAGIQSGLLPALTTSLTSLLVFGSVNLMNKDSGSTALTTPVAQWIAVGLLAGLLSGWARSLLQQERRTTTSYATAHHLLTELRDVSRELPTGLDEVSLSQQVLAELDDVLEFDRGAVYTRDTSGVINPLAYRGADRLDWNPASGHENWQAAFVTSNPIQRDEAISAHMPGFSGYFPMRLGERTIGLVAVERDAAPWSARNLDDAQAIVDEAALRIETGQLFSEVRSIATVEERRRLAREIHDGIAQEIASLGYVVDDLSASSHDEGVGSALHSLRGELTRIVSELRLSIFDLRTDVQPSAGLGAALSSYVRSMSTGTGITMHMVLDESALRLPIEAETEVLRIAQEAITNARRHARARNLWVTCRVDPPVAFLRIADDGQGLGSPRGDSFGMEIMRERAERLGAQLSIRQRVGGGTVVELSLGAPVVVDATLAEDTG